MLRRNEEEEIDTQVLITDWDQELGEDDLDYVDDLDFEEIEDEEEDENMGHKLVTSNPEMDWDWDYFFNEKYFE